MKLGKLCWILKYLKIYSLWPFSPPHNLVPRFRSEVVSCCTDNYNQAPQNWWEQVQSVDCSFMCGLFTDLLIKSSVYLSEDCWWVSRLAADERFFDTLPGCGHTHQRRWMQGTACRRRCSNKYRNEWKPAVRDLRKICCEICFDGHEDLSH